MQKLPFLLLLMLFLLTLNAGAQSKPVLFTVHLKTTMKQQVQEAARHAWSDYKTYASAFDDLQPLTKTGTNWYNHSMLMTPVDAFDSFLQLGLQKEAAEAKYMILSSLNFNIDNEAQILK